MTRRVKIRFESGEALAASRALETPDLTERVINPSRKFISVELDSAAEAAFAREGLAAASAQSSLQTLADEFGGEIVEDYQYEMEEDFSFDTLALETEVAGSMDDVLGLINARKAWKHSRGEGVTIAIVDTGINGTHPEFPTAKKAGSWQPVGETPWTDWNGHGTMCATIAAASGPRYHGVAPEAKLISCMTRFYDSELASIYDFLTARAEDGEKIIASNSFGYKTGTPPTPDPHSDFIPALNDAIAAGVFIAFSAGNNHKRAGGTPNACDPNSVWLHKSRDDLLAVATCDLDKKMWYYSSRGPGQFYGDPDTSQKPDVTAPTPKNGKILYGVGERVLANGWGTSGACPQVAGLAALIRSSQPHLPAEDVRNTIRGSAAALGVGWNCQGAGLIDCYAAVTASGPPAGGVKP